MFALIWFLSMNILVSLGRISSITNATYAFVQQLIGLKLLDLDNDDYEKGPHRYRTRVDADAAALELLCLSCDDEIGTVYETSVIEQETAPREEREREVLECVSCASIPCS